MTKKTLSRGLVVLVIVVGVFFVQQSMFSCSNFPQLKSIAVVKPGTPNIAWRAPAYAPGSGSQMAACTSLDAPGVFLTYSDGSEWDAYTGKLGERFLAWSPDGRYVAVRVEQQPEVTPRAFALVVIDAGKKTMERVSDYLPGLGRPAWRLLGNGRMEVYAPIPDGLVIRVYETGLTGAGPDFRLYEQAGEIWLARDSGPRQQISQGGGYAPALAPDGQRFLYQWGNDIYLAGVTDPPGPHTPVAGGVAPCWSPDGRHIAFVVATDSGSDESQRSDIWLLDAAQPADAAVRLTNTPQDKKLDLAWPEQNRLYFAVQNDGSIRCAELNREE